MTSFFLSAANPTPAEITAESARANVFFDRVFDESISRSPMSMAQHLGMKKDNDKWDDLTDAHALEDLGLSVQHLAELKRTINFDLLDEQAKVSYRMFVDEAELAIEGWRWRLYNYPLNQMSGLHSEAPALLINYHQVDNVSDARAYIARLRGMGAMFDQLIEGVKIRAAKNIVPPKFVFPLVIDSARDVISGEPFDQAGKKCALLEDFETKVGALKDITAAEKSQLLADARAALSSRWSSQPMRS